MKINNKTFRRNALTYALVAAAYVVLQMMQGSLSSSLKGMVCVRLRLCGRWPSP